VASFYDPKTLYAVLVVAATALREAAQLRSAVAVLCDQLKCGLDKGLGGEEALVAALDATRSLVQSDDVGGGRSIGYMLVLATQLDVDAERIAVRSPAVRKLRSTLDPDWASRYSPSHNDAVARRDVSRETSEEETDTDPGVGPDSPAGT